ncbi:MAG: hypothetical protein CMM29_09580 [Rhodospirillaceae bacterium]|nr:hypothetical protein [Rhodospirillaceae bacterium]
MAKISITLSFNSYEMAERLEYFLNRNIETKLGLSPDDPNYISMTNNFEDTKEFSDYCDKQ